MKILQVSPGYYPAIGGVEQHVRQISERLAREHDVTVFATDPSGQLPPEEEMNGVKVRRFKSYSPGNAYHLSFEMIKELKRAKGFDVVHGHSYHAFPLLFSRYAEGNRFVVNPHYHGHGHTPLRNILLKPYKMLGRNIFRDADKVIADSKYERTLVLKDFPMKAEKSVVIPSGIDLAEFRGLAKTEKPYRTILHVGRLEQYKGIEYVIQALPSLDEDIILDIVGRGPFRENLVSLAAGLGLEGRVGLYHDLSREELLAMYANADLFIMPSRYEAFGIVVAEALASKTPCIVANTSALSEWVDNENCFGIDYPIDTGRLADLIREVIGQQVGDVKLWDWDDVVAETLKVYEA